MQFYRNYFGKILQNLLKERGIKQNKFAEKIGVDAPNVSRWVGGQVFPDEENFRAICDFFKVGPETFLPTEKDPKLDIFLRDIENNQAAISDLAAFLNFYNLYQKAKPDLQEAALELLRPLEQSSEDNGSKSGLK